MMARLYREPERLARVIRAADPGLFDQGCAVLDRFRGEGAAGVQEDGF
ncbi:unnamed protein product [[Actinomadura] parvosata subsp. kistnae]|nr:unnamed protein product [Actinomadura parvosata subsp. kistnae]